MDGKVFGKNRIQFPAHFSRNSLFRIQVKKKYNSFPDNFQGNYLN